MLKGCKHHATKVLKYEDGGMVTEAQRVGAARSAHEKSTDLLYDAGREPAGKGIKARAQNAKMQRLSDLDNATQTALERAKSRAGWDD